MKKYQGMVPKKPLLTLVSLRSNLLEPCTRRWLRGFELTAFKVISLQGGQKKKCFDSADWALAKEGRSEDLPNSLTALPPKLKPPSTPVLKRKASNLGRS